MPETQEVVDLLRRLDRLAALPPTEAARGMIASYIRACEDAARAIRGASHSA